MNLLAEPAPTRLPEDPEPTRAMDGGASAVDVAAQWPTFSAAWAALAVEALDRGALVEGYAYARTGYHRGLDALRRSGWRGTGPIPWSHHPNRGFLRSLAALARAAEALGEADEATRCRAFLAEADPVAAQELR
jgi:hypothetical protein